MNAREPKIEVMARFRVMFMAFAGSEFQTFQPPSKVIQSLGQSQEQRGGRCEGYMDNGGRGSGDGATGSPSDAGAGLLATMKDVGSWLMGDAQ